MLTKIKEVCGKSGARCIIGKDSSIVMIESRKKCPGIKLLLDDPTIAVLEKLHYISERLGTNVYTNIPEDEKYFFEWRGELIKVNLEGYHWKDDDVLMDILFERMLNFVVDFQFEVC